MSDDLSGPPPRACRAGGAAHRFRIHGPFGPTNLAYDRAHGGQVNRDFPRYSRNAGLYRLVDEATGLTIRAWHDGVEIHPVYARCTICNRYFAPDDTPHTDHRGEDIHAHCCETSGPCSEPNWKRSPLNP